MKLANSGKKHRRCNVTVPLKYGGAVPLNASIVMCVPASLTSGKYIELRQN